MMKVEEISVASCVPFSGNPFKVRDDFDMELLVQSVLDYGVMFPIMVRPLDGGKYEIVSGHRRVHACEKAGIDKIPAFIKSMSRDEAVIMMVDSNLQRESLLPSEKAFAYKLKMDALKRQGKRTDLTSDRVGPKLTAAEISDDDSAISSMRAGSRSVPPWSFRISRMLRRRRCTNTTPRTRSRPRIRRQTK